MAEIANSAPLRISPFVVGGSRRSRWLLLSLILLFTVLHGLVLLAGTYWQGVVYTIAAPLYPLVGYSIIALTTWYGARGWHGLLAALLVLFVFYSDLPATLGTHSIAAALFEPNLDMLVWFDDVVFQFLMCFAIALCVKPLYVTMVVDRSVKLKYDLVDMLWITFAMAFAFYAWQKLYHRPGFAGQVFISCAVSMLACASVLSLRRTRKVPAAILMILALVLYVLN